MQNSKLNTSLFYNFLLQLNYLEHMLVLYQLIQYYIFSKIFRNNVNNHYKLDDQILVTHNVLVLLFDLFLAPSPLLHFHQKFLGFVEFPESGSLSLSSLTEELLFFWQYQTHFPD